MGDGVINNWWATETPRKEKQGWGHHTNLAPILLEAILFLWLNPALWDKKTLQEVHLAVTADQNEERLIKKLDLEEEQTEDNNESVECEDKDE